MKLADLKIDPDFKNLLPELDAETYTALEKDIVSNGILDPIITWNGYIADGHNRYEICKAHYINDIKTTPLNKNTKAEVMQWIVDHQFAKRNLKKSERVLLLSKVEAQITKEAEAKVIESGKLYGKGHPKVTANLPQPNEEKKRNDTTAGQMAKKLGVSEKTYRDMKTVVEKGTKGQIERMDKGGKGNGASTIAREVRMGAKDGERVCSTCGKIKPISEFCQSKSKINMCLECKRKGDKQSSDKRSGLEKITKVAEFLKRPDNTNRAETQSAMADISFLANNVKSTIRRLIETGKTFDAETISVISDLVVFLENIKGEKEHDLQPE